MYDLNHQVGGDLVLSPTGDLALVSGATLSLQRVLRRLLTNPTNYLWHQTYGAGLPASLGKPAGVNRLQAIIRAQMLQESAVSRNPPPVISVAQSPSDPTTFVANISYIDANTRQVQTLSVPVTP